MMKCILPNKDPHRALEVLGLLEYHLANLQGGNVAVGRGQRGQQKHGDSDMVFCASKGVQWYLCI